MRPQEKKGWISWFKNVKAESERKSKTKNKKYLIWFKGESN